jgi:hypothetical protein
VDIARCGGCRQPIGDERTKCPACGWILLSDPLACLERDDAPPRQRYAIELELRAVAQTGPKLPAESSNAYRARVLETLQRLIERDQRH